MIFLPERGAIQPSEHRGFLLHKPDFFEKTRLTLLPGWKIIITCWKDAPFHHPRLQTERYSDNSYRSKKSRAI
jgi:hypothetical protein